MSRFLCGLSGSFLVYRMGAWLSPGGCQKHFSRCQAQQCCAEDRVLGGCDWWQKQFLRDINQVLVLTILPLGRGWWWACNGVGQLCLQVRQGLPRDSEGDKRW